jgi:hypothetical protein
VGVRAGHLIRRALSRLRPAGVVLALAGLLAFLPFSTCLSRVWLGLPCPACGLTRAGLALARGHLAEASRWNPAAAPLVLLFAASIVVAAVVDDAAWKRFVEIATAVAAVALLVVWGARFFGAFGGVVP